MATPSDSAHSRLSIVATPIGNLGDITLRALETLRACNVVFAEDTRITAKLFAKYEIKKPLKRLDAITEIKKSSEIIARLEAGEHIAYTSDAGTPGISDPGARLVAEVRTQLPEARIETIPGPSAITAALSVAGVSTENGFIFYGFLPHKKGRQTALKKIAASDLPIILYESPHRIMKLLKEFHILMPSFRITIARELTKLHEEIISGTPAELITHFTINSDSVRGEFVAIVHSC